MNSTYMVSAEVAVAALAVETHGGLTVEVINQWRRVKALHPRGRGTQGRYLYDLADITELAREQFCP